MISINGLDKAAVLAALYNRAKPQGMGFLHYAPEPMTAGEAKTYLQGHLYFDYLNGRVMKVDLKSDSEFEERLYDRDNGQGAAAAVVKALRESGQLNAFAPEHKTAALDAAATVKARIAIPSGFEADGTFRLGFDPAVGPAVDAALEKL